MRCGLSHLPKEPIHRHAPQVLKNATGHLKNFDHAAVKYLAERSEDIVAGANKAVQAAQPRAGVKKAPSAPCKPPKSDTTTAKDQPVPVGAHLLAQIDGFASFAKEVRTRWERDPDLHVQND